LAAATGVNTTGNPPTDAPVAPTATSAEPPAGNAVRSIRVIAWPCVRDAARGFALTGDTGTDLVPGDAATEPDLPGAAKAGGTASRLASTASAVPSATPRTALTATVLADRRRSWWASGCQCAANITLSPGSRGLTASTDWLSRRSGHRTGKRCQADRCAAVAPYDNWFTLLTTGHCRTERTGMGVWRQKPAESRRQNRLRPTLPDTAL
jgi:hypothetical protein